jgi:hypothetical protein
MRRHCRFRLGIQIASVAGNSTRPLEVRSNRFVLEDEDGKARAEISMSKDVPLLKQSPGEFFQTPITPGRGDRAEPSNLKDVPCLKLFDEKGKSSVVLVVSKDGPRLILADEEGRSRVGLAVCIDGPRLSLCDEKGEPRVLLTMGRDGPGLNLSDEKGQSRVVLNFGNDVARLDLRDERESSAPGRIGRRIWSTRLFARPAPRSR